jgi:NADH-quinone oxidoreductase subunit N
MLVGGLNAIYEQKLKRFIAYSSINQIGFLFIGLLGTNSSIQGIQAFIYFFITYIINLTLFLNLIIYYTKYKYFVYNYETNSIFDKKKLINLTYITDFQKLFKIEFYKIMQKKSFIIIKQNNEPTVYFILFAIVLFSLAGIPPLIGFFGKFYILLYAFKLKYFIIVIFGILISIISVFYYLRLLKTIFFEDFYLKLEKTKEIALKYIQIKNIKKTIFYKFILIFILFILPLFSDNFLLQQSFELTQSCYILIN